MLLALIVLFVTALAAGLAAFFMPTVKQDAYKLILVFAGAYLFSITVIHILPELYFNADDPTVIGMYVLGGFFLQQVLEYFSKGTEHGHVHIHEGEHKKSVSAVIPIISGLSLHAFLEGTLLSHPGTIHEEHDASALLIGIALHKAPAAFALMTILICYLTNKRWAIFLLVLFSLASPLGMLMGDFVIHGNLISDQLFNVLFGVVSGNFLHISTTIVFESSADHSFNAKKLGIAVSGAMVALAAEIWL